MYRILIVDDEERIVKLICALIDTQKLGVEVVGEAYDGRQALELVRSLKPDILITDIRMPDMDGISLIKCIREEKLSIHVIALSGYQEFDYAYNAIKYGVDDYLVKPINAQDLNSAIEKAISNETIAQSPPVATQTSQTSQTSQKIYEYFMDLLFSGQQFSMSVDQINQEFMLDFVPGSYFSLAVCVDSPLPEDDRHLVKAKLRDQLKNCLEEFCARAVTVYRDSVFVCIGNIGGSGSFEPEQARDGKSLNLRMKQVYERISIALEPYSNTTITIGLSETADTVSFLPQLVRDAWLCARVKYIRGTQRIYHIDQMDTPGANVQLSGAQTLELRRIIENRMVSTLASWMDNALADADALHRPIQALQRLDAVYASFNQLCDLSGIPFAEEGDRRALAALRNASHYDETRAKLLDYMKSTLELDRKARQKNDSYYVTQAKKFMLENMDKQIRLEDLASYVALTPTYLSALFKKETGENLSDFLLRIRLEEAQQLLRLTAMSIGEISQRVGYASARHFSKMFQKQTGVRPLEYRRLYQL